MSSFFKVDTHCHILPKHIPDFKKSFGYGGFVYLDHKSDTQADMMLDDGSFFRTVDNNLWDYNVRIDEMNEVGVDVQVLSTVPVMFNYWAKPQHTLEISKFLNDNLIEAVKSHPDRFIGLATLPMNDVDLAIKELERVHSLGFEGIQIGSHINELNLDNSTFKPLYEKLQELDMAIFVHPWKMPWRDEKFWAGWLIGMPAETSKSICDLMFGGIFDEFPKLRFSFAHCAGSFPGTIGRIDHGYNVRPDLFSNQSKSPKDYLGHFYADSLTADSKILEFNLSILGEDKIMLGSDYPFPLGEKSIGKIISELEAFDDSVKAKIYGLSALNWLGVSIDKFSKN